MNKYKVILYIILLAVSVSCNRKNPKEINIWAENTGEISVTHKGRVLMSYNPITDQTGTSENMFWLTSDTMDYYFSLTLNQKPVLGQTVKGNIIYKLTNGTVKQKTGLDFDTVKTGPEGKVWLYNNSQKLGFVVELQ